MSKRILFVIPRNKSLFGDKTSLTGHPHVGIAYLASFLKRHGIELSIYDDGIEFSHPRLLERIRDFKPDLIGITIFSYCYGFAQELIRLIRANCKIPIVAGGPHVSAVRGDIFRQSDIDFAVKHEGEYTLLEFLGELDKPRPDLRKITGLIWKDAGGVTENPDRPFIQNLDDLPFPDYDAFGIERYPCHKARALPLITSRGCPFACNYCSVSLSMGRNFRARSSQNVFSEIKYLVERGWNSFDINDDCFTLDKQRAERICDLIIEQRLGLRFQLYNGIRVDTVSPALLKKMKTAGCFFISYGCEAGTERVLKTIKKGINLQQVRDAVNWTNEAGIHNSVNFIIGHTDETYQDARETLNFARSLPTDFVNFYNLLPYPGTESFAWVNQHASFIIPPDEFLNEISYRDNVPVFETPEFTREERREIVAMGFDLYRQRILTYRLGKVLGGAVYFITGIDVINRLATNFALTNPLGRLIYTRLSRKSVETKE